jgi:hypothetical protein
MEILGWLIIERPIEIFERFIFEWSVHLPMSADVFFPGIPFLSCWTAPTESDRKHSSAVTGRTLNKHEHVDKQLFEILELAARAGEYSRRFSEQHFAKYLIQRKFMNGSRLIERCKIDWAAGRPALKRRA